jgi:hypothetical protein
LVLNLKPIIEEDSISLWSAELTKSEKNLLFRIPCSSLMLKQFIRWYLLSTHTNCISIIKPPGKNQKAALLSLGKATSWTPNWVGSKKFPKAPNIKGIIM